MKVILIVIFVLLSYSAAFGQTATVISENANLRGTPKTSGKVVDTLGMGTVVEVVKQQGSWFLVQAQNYAGWLHGNTIKLSDQLRTLEGTTIPEIEQRPPRTVVSPTPNKRQSTSSQVYVRGPRGGCYYLSSTGRKIYVDRSLCN